MKQIKKRIAGFSIRKKLIFYSYLFIAPILLLISCLLFQRNYRNAVKNEENTCISDVKRLSDSICEIQKGIMEMGTYISINDEITRILSSNEAQELNKDAQIWLHQAPMQIVQDMMALDGIMKTIALYPENGVIPYLRCMDNSAYIGTIEEIRKQEIYNQTVNEKGKFLWQRIGKYESDTYQFNRNDKIVMYRMIYDLARKNCLGYLVIGSSAEVFDKTCKNALSDADEAIVVMSGYGAELIRCGDIKQEVISEILQQKFECSIDGDGLASCQYENYRVYLCKDMDVGTVTYKIVPQVTLSDFVDSIIITPLVLLLGILVGLYPVLILISNIVTKPLHNLVVAMEHFKKGDFTQKIEVLTMDEVGEVTACFNRMVDDIRDLIDKNYVLVLKERESELDTLQAQINPHFLYNTLDSLYWKALECGNEDIGEDILSLSQLFRLALNRGNGIVTVQMEMELLERYLHIQKMRFGKRLNYEVHMDESILSAEIPKLILQPFVENAIVHGFEKGEKEYLLSVEGELIENYMVFRVIDSGVGMSEEQLMAVWDSAENRKYASQRIGRFAIKNVKERLQLMYKDDYELTLESKEGYGTTVIITIPCRLKENGSYE